MQSVSIVVPTYNRREALLRCVASLPADVETIVVDDGSTDGTGPPILSLRRENVVYVRRLNGGPAAARNTGVKLATSPFVAFIDDDCQATGTWPWPLVDRLSSEPRDVAGCGGRVLPYSNNVVSRYFTFHRILEPPASCSYLVTANCAFRRTALLEVEGFNEQIRHPGGEDPELASRLRGAGYRFVFEPGAQITHEYRPSIVDFARTFQRYGRGCAHVVGA